MSSSSFEKDLAVHEYDWRLEGREYKALLRSLTYSSLCPYLAFVRTKTEKFNLMDCCELARLLKSKAKKNVGVALCAQEICLPGSHVRTAQKHDTRQHGVCAFLSKRTLLLLSWPENKKTKEAALCATPTKDKEWLTWRWRAPFTN